MDTNVKLTDEQQAAVELAVKAIQSNAPMTRIGGYAGTGKTTIIHKILESCGKRMIVCAYTGKAACVLRSKGIPDARTIHACIYDLIEREVRNPKTGKVELVIEWGRVSVEDLKADGFIIDEASMVGKELLDDLVAFGLPIVAIGDPGQLPPVSKHDVNLMLDPDLVLSKIHRQAEESGIVRLATQIRQGGLATLSGFNDVRVVAKHEARHRDADVHICGFNKTRAWLNERVRGRKGRTGGALLVPDERIIALSNDTQLGVFNGLMGTVAAVASVVPYKVFTRYDGPIDVELITAEVLWDGAEKPRMSRISSYALGGAGGKVDWSVSSAHFGDMIVADYGYAITCHKSQGSQWDRVVVLDEAAPRLWDQKRWLYTAVTRAAKHLVLGAES